MCGHSLTCLSSLECVCSDMHSISQLIDYIIEVQSTGIWKSWYNRIKRKSR